MTDPLILGFDTSAAHCAAALLRGDRLLGSVHEPMDRGQAERLMPLLENLLAEHGATWRDLAALGVGTGPGNFTGIRIAVAAARGLALSLSIPAIGVTAFQALAAGQDQPVLTAVDARRGAFYLQAGAEPPMLVPGSLPEWLHGSGLDVLGHDAKGLAALTGGAALQPRWPLAEAIARQARARYPHPEPRPAPLYLRSADAAPPADPPPVILP